MNSFDNTPTYCPYCNSKLEIDITPCSKNGIDGVELALYCEHCDNNFWLDLGFKANNINLDDAYFNDINDDYDDYDYDVDDYDDYDYDVDDYDDYDYDVDDYNYDINDDYDIEDDDDISLLYPNDSQEDAFDDAFDTFIKKI